MPDWFSHHPMISGVLATLIACLPSLIMAAKERPKTQNALTTLLKFLSWLQPRNSIGTLKMPGKEPAPAVPEYIDMDPPSPDGDDPDDVETVPGIKSPRVTVLAMGFLALFASACAHAPAPAKVARAFVDCTGAAMKSQMMDLFPQVYTTLAGDQAEPDWQGVLGHLEASAGNAVVCTIASILRDFETAPRGSRLPPEGQDIVNNGHEYLQLRGDPLLKL